MMVNELAIDPATVLELQGTQGLAQQRTLDAG